MQFLRHLHLSHSAAVLSVQKYRPLHSGNSNKCGSWSTTLQKHLLLPTHHQNIQIKVHLSSKCSKASVQGIQGFCQSSRTDRLTVLLLYLILIAAGNSNFPVDKRGIWSDFQAWKWQIWGTKFMISIYVSLHFLAHSNLYLTKALCIILHPGTRLHPSMDTEKQKWVRPPTVIFSQEMTSLQANTSSYGLTIEITEWVFMICSSSAAWTETRGSFWGQKPMNVIQRLCFPKLKPILWCLWSPTVTRALATVWASGEPPESKQDPTQCTWLPGLQTGTQQEHWELPALTAPPPQGVE